MADLEQNATERQEITYFKEMVNGAEKLIKPWKALAITLAVVIILSNVAWAIVHGYAIKKAYQEPSTYEYEYTQDQDLDSQSQKQSANGGGSN